VNFGEAIEALKAGKRVQRSGWNGKGMWIVLLRPGTGPLDSEYATDPPLPIDPCLAMRTAPGTLQPGWLASQADILSEDWSVLD